MKTISKDTQHWPVLKVKTALRAGYYLGITLSAGAGGGPSADVSNNAGAGASSTAASS